MAEEKKKREELSEAKLKKLPAGDILKRKKKLLVFTETSAATRKADPSTLAALMEDAGLTENEIEQILITYELLEIEFEPEDEEDLEEGIDAEAIFCNEGVHQNAESSDTDALNKDSVGAYLAEIGEYPLLTPEEEIDLTKRIKAALDAQEELEKNPEIPEERRAKLETAAKNLPSLKRKMVEANLRLVVSVAKKSLGRGVSILDLIQEGNIGLIKAIEKFDPAVGTRFSTYATWWIRQAISRSIAENGRTIRLPVHVVDAIHKMKKTTKELAMEIGRDPAANEVADAMGISKDKYEELNSLVLEPVSIFSPVGESEDGYLGEFLADEHCYRPDDFVCYETLRSDVDVLMSSLSPREYRIIRLRYGLEDGHQRTLEEVGLEYNVTRERIRQIENKAMKKLKQNALRTNMNEYLK